MKFLDDDRILYRLIPEWASLNHEKAAIERILLDYSAKIGMTSNRQSQHTLQEFEHYVHQKELAYEEMRENDTKMKSAFNTFAKTDLAYDLFRAEDYRFSKMQDEEANDIRVITIMLPHGKVSSYPINLEGE